MTENICETIAKAVTDGLAEDYGGLINDAFAAGFTASQIMQQGPIAGIEKAGELWKANEFFMPDIILAADAFKKAMCVLVPHLKAADIGNQSKTFIIGVVEGEMHDLGKDLVIAMLQSSGLNVIDLGVDVPKAKFIDAVRERKPDILGLGAYMTTTMGEMQAILDELKEEQLRDTVKVMVGGVPTSQGFADEISADAWGKDALVAMQKALELTGG